MGSFDNINDIDEFSDISIKKAEIQFMKEMDQ